jgi:hypothetical protein
MICLYCHKSIRRPVGHVGGKCMSRENREQERKKMELIFSEKFEVPYGGYTPRVALHDGRKPKKIELEQKPITHDFAPRGARAPLQMPGLHAYNSGDGSGSYQDIGQNLMDDKE